MGTYSVMTNHSCKYKAELNTHKFYLFCPIQVQEGQELDIAVDTKRSNIGNDDIISSLPTSYIHVYILNFKIKILQI